MLPAGAFQMVTYTPITCRLIFSRSQVGPMILHFNQLSTGGFIDNTSNVKNVHLFQPSQKVSYTDFLNLSTISAQLEAKHSGCRDAWRMEGNWVSASLMRGALLWGST